MKNNASIFLLAICLFTNIGIGFSHALYIDTNAKGTIGETQEINVYYSEFADRTHEKVTDWYSNVASFELWLVRPNGERTLLKTTAKKDHFTANFVPKEKGLFRLEINHTASDVAKGTAYQFNAYAQVLVGKTSGLLPVTNQQDLVLLEKITSQNGRNKTFKIYFKGALEEGISATLFLPSGKTKTVKSNAEGIIEIETEEKGIYFLEATTYHENKAGSTQKADFKSIWRCATQKFEI